VNALESNEDSGNVAHVLFGLAVQFHDIGDEVHQTPPEELKKTPKREAGLAAGLIRLCRRAQAEDFCFRTLLELLRYKLAAYDGYASLGFPAKHIGAGDWMRSPSQRLRRPRRAPFFMLPRLLGYRHRGDRDAIHIGGGVPNESRVLGDSDCRDLF
jgi:hypothetical protein